MSAPLVYIIILNWNGRDMLLDCLESLRKITYPNANVLVVDNGSTDDSVISIKAKFPNVELLQLPSNLGYAKGNNSGFEFVKNIKPDFIIFLNNDTLVDPGFIEPLIQPLIDDSDVGQTVPKIFYADDPERIWFGGSYINLWLGIIRHEGIRKKDHPDYNKVKEVAYATGCCMCIRAVDFEKLGGFDESFSMYAEDADLSLRIQEEGKKVMFTPDSKVWHKVSASIGGVFSFKKTFKKETSNIVLIKKHGTLYQFIFSILFWPVRLIYFTFQYLKLRIGHS